MSCRLVLACDLAGDVADGAAEIGPQGAKRPVGALELLCMGIALVPDQGELADPRIGLAEIEPCLLRQRHQPLAGPVQELGVGREHDVLGLHRGIDDHPPGVFRAHRPGLHRHGQALLQQGHDALLPHPLPPAGHRGAVEGQIVPEEGLAAEELEIRVLHPAGAELLVREIERMLEDRQPRHQPRGSGGMPGPSL